MINPSSAFLSVLSATLFMMLTVALAAAEPSIDLPDADTQPSGAPVTFTLRDLDPSVEYWVTLVPAGTALGDWAEYSYIEDVSVAEVTLPGVAAGAYELRLHDQASGYPLYAQIPVIVLDTAPTNTTSQQVAPGIEISDAEALKAEAPVKLVLRDLDPSVSYWVTLVPETTPVGEWNEYSYIDNTTEAEVTLPGVKAGAYELRLHDQASGYPLYAKLAVTILDEVNAQPTVPDIVPVMELANTEALREGAPVVVALRDLDPSKSYWVTLVPDTTPVGEWAEYADIGTTEATEVTFEGVTAGNHELRLHGQADGYPLYATVALSVVDDSVPADWEDVIGQYTGNTTVDYLGYVGIDLVLADEGALFEYEVRRRSCKTVLLSPDETEHRTAEPYSVRNACYDGTRVAVRRMTATSATFEFQIDNQTFSAKIPRTLGPAPEATPQERAEDLRGFSPKMTGAEFEQLAAELGYSVDPMPKRISIPGGRTQWILGAYKTLENSSSIINREDLATDAVTFFLRSYDTAEFEAQYAGATTEEKVAAMMAAIKNSQGLFVVRWQSFPTGQQPSGKRIDESLRAKYGSPSIFNPENRMPDAGQYEWHSSADTGLAHTSPEVCSIDKRHGVGALQVFAPKRMLGLQGGIPWDATADVSAQATCGVSVYADLATDTLGAATRLTMMSIDHSAYLNEQWLQAEALAVGTMAEVSATQQQADSVEPDL